MTVISDHGSAMHREAADILCGALLGYGMTRHVYACRVLPDCVVKIEEAGHAFQNVIEWETWQRVKDTEASRWFAECKWISPNGSVLVMERTRQPRAEDYPDKMPMFLCDFKRSNYGMAASQRGDGSAGPGYLVCHDYGTNMLFEHGMTKRLRRAEWWDEK